MMVFALFGFYSFLFAFLVPFRVTGKPAIFFFLLSAAFLRLVAYFEHFTILPRDVGVGAELLRLRFLLIPPALVIFCYLD